MGKYLFNYNILDLIYINSRTGLVSQIINFIHIKSSKARQVSILTEVV